MWLYLIIFFVAVGFMSSRKYAKSIGYLAGFLLFLALFVGFADMLGGYDRYAYCDLFDGIYDDRVSGLGLAFEHYNNERGYMWLNYGISFITGNRYIFVLLLTIMIYAVMYPSFKEYMEDYSIAIVLFLALMFFFSFTYLREISGVMIAWYAVRFVYKRQLPQFLLFTFIAYSLHNSAVIFLPLFFVPIRKFNKATVKKVMAVLLIIGLSPLPGAMFNAFGGLVGTEERVNQYSEEYDMGFLKLDYVIEAFFFLYIIFRNYDKVLDDKKHIVLMNTAIIFCGVLLFFVRSSSGGRLGWYYMIGVIATITSIMVHTKQTVKMRQYMTFISFILYFRIVFEWGILLSPYKTFLTDGHREGDKIFDRFEYDLKYDEDKFYRPAFVLFGGAEK